MDKKPVNKSNPKWWNLRKNLCPLCSALLADTVIDNMLSCSKCHFKIGVDKASKIIEDQNTKDLINKGYIGDL